MSVAIESMRKRIYNMAADAAHDAFHRYCADINTVLYLCYRPAADGAWGDAVVVTEISGDLEYAWQDHIPRDMTLPQLTDWCLSKLNRCPIVGE